MPASRLGMAGSEACQPRVRLEPAVPSLLVEAALLLETISLAMRAVKASQEQLGDCAPLIEQRDNGPLKGRYPNEKDCLRAWHR